ncbi:MAG: hypothetical protein ROO76_01105 [Terriglobia bacterium]|jgi:cytoskeletal protein RodZ|nr:hypothetical protein [Terriglobia bacterium]
MFAIRKLIYLLVFALAFAVCGVPDVVAQQQSSGQSQQQSRQTQQPSTSGVTVNPAQAPLSPPPSEEQPTTIYEGNPPSAPPQTTTVQQQTPQQQQKQPLGAATAGAVTTEGGGASRPAGTAIAPAKQHQVRSFLIKLGAVAAAGVAIGTVYALSKGTSSVPPNSGR